jgi:hypothetical protein
MLMSGLNCYVWVHVTPNVHAIEIYYAIPCKACFIGEEYAAAKEGIFTALLKEPLPKFLVGV